jgi:formamidopyrimidine-DNA glycosylase
MPELPEVETMRRGLLPIVGCSVRRVVLPKSRLRPIQMAPKTAAFRRRVVGRGIVSVGRVGKRVVIELDSGDRIVIEPRMTGRVLLAESPDAEHVRLVLELAGGGHGRLIFWDSRGLGVVRLLSPRQFAERLGPEKIGPDALAITADELRSRLGRSRRAIKVALLDQARVAGIGNLYASEILHRAGVHPERACDKLRPAEWNRVQAAIGEVLHEAIACQGSTLADGTYRTATNEAGAFQGRHRVYQRAGQNCRQCAKGQIVRVVQAQRSTFYCPACQRRRRV